jgi:serine protease AprX
MKRARTSRAVLLVSALAGLVFGGAPPVYGVGSPNAEVDRALRQVQAAHPHDQVQVILQAAHPTDARQAVLRANGRIGTPLPQIGAVAATVSADQIDTLAAQPGVGRIALDASMQAVAKPDTSASPLSVFPQSVGAPSAWSAGFNGAGSAIAVLDSGVQPAVDLGAGGGLSRVIVNLRFNQGASSTADQYGHGTWVSGIAAGSGAASNGAYMGVAPAASIVNLKVTDDTGVAHVSNVLQALAWVVDNHAAYNIRAVNLSLVSTLSEGYATNLLDAAVEMVWLSGVPVVVSAGNAGANTLQFAPANDPYAITVGATDDAGTPAVGDDSLAWFSGFGKTQDGFSKPDLVAPGRHIVGPLATSGAFLASEFPAKVLNRRYIQLSGTSAAAPIVSGAVALLGQARPALTPDQVKWLLVHSAQPLAASPTGTGAGELNVAGALHVQGSVPRANLGLVPNQLLALAYLTQTGQPSVSWDSVSWGSVSWDSVSWDSVSWDSVSWDSVSWDSVSWDSTTTDTIVGND